MRGALNEDCQRLANDFLGREISKTELRLYPYIDFVMKNGQYMDPRKINNEDRKILSSLRSEKYIDYSLRSFGDQPMRTYLELTKEFYDFINQVLWYTYVLRDDESEGNE